MAKPLRRPLIALVTHGERLGARTGIPPDQVEDRLVRQASEAAAAGIDLFQIRELDLDGSALLRLVERAVGVARGSALRVVVNDRLDVALAAGAHGVHLRGDSYPAWRIRPLTPPGFIVGRSVHDADEAAGVVGEGGVDYLVFGTVFATGSKPGHAPAGPGALAGVVHSAQPVPVLAIGGVSAQSAPLLAGAGAAGVAAIGLFLPRELGGSGSIGDTVAQLRAAFDSTVGAH